MGNSDDDYSDSDGDDDDSIDRDETGVVQTTFEDFEREIDEGEVVFDGTTEVVVVEERDEDAGDLHIEAIDETVASYNDVPDDDSVYGGVYADEIDRELDDGWREMDPETLREEVLDTLDEDSVYDLPESRLVSEIDMDEVHELVTEYENADDLHADAAESWQYGTETALEEVVDTDDFFEDQLPEIQQRWDRLDDLAENPDQFDAVVIHDGGDADGATSGTLYKQKFGERAVRIPANSGGDYGRGVEDGIEKAIESAPDGMPIYVADLGPTDGPRFVRAVREGNNPVFVRDHHEISDNEQMVDAIIDAVEDSGGEYTFVRDADSAARIVFENDIDQGEVENYDALKDLVDVTDVADSFDTEHERWPEALRLRSLQYEFTLSKYEETVADGPDFSGTRAARDIKVLSEVDKVRNEFATDHASSFEMGDYTGVEVYAGGADRSVVGSRAMEEHDADFAIITTANDKLSFRSRDGDPPVDGIARSFGGGGHEDAAGAGDLGFENFDTTREEHHENYGRDIIEGAKSAIREELE